jgi:hypothetical protein
MNLLSLSTDTLYLIYSELDRRSVARLSLVSYAARNVAERCMRDQLRAYTAVVSGPVLAVFSKYINAGVPRVYNVKYDRYLPLNPMLLRGDIVRVAAGGGYIAVVNVDGRCWCSHTYEDSEVHELPGVTKDVYFEQVYSRGTFIRLVGNRIVISSAFEKNPCIPICDIADEIDRILHAILWWEDDEESYIIVAQRRDEVISITQAGTRVLAKNVRSSYWDDAGVICVGSIGTFYIPYDGQAQPRLLTALKKKCVFYNSVTMCLDNERDDIVGSDGGFFLLRRDGRLVMRTETTIDTRVVALMSSYKIGNYLSYIVEPDR